VPYWILNYHLVWSTKNREPALLGEVTTAVQRAIWTTAKKLKLDVHALNVQPDHVHFVCSAQPKHSPAELARQMKGSSSYFLGKQHEGFWPGWQTEYGVVGFGGQSLARVVDYVNNQDDHHRENRLWLEFERGLDTPLPDSVAMSVFSPKGTSDV
jgi:putative transposase